MKEPKKFAFDVGITFIASVISMLLGFIITVLLGRYLGAEELGLYRMAFTIYGIAMLFAAIGIPAAIIKYVAEHKGDRRKTNSIVSAGVITSLFLGIGFSILFFISSGIFEGIFKMPGLSSLLIILSPVFPFALVSGTLLGFLNGLREMKKYGIATILQSILMLIVSLVLIYQGFGVAGVVTGIVLSSIGSCFYLMKISRHYFEIVLEGYAQTTKEILLFGVQILGANAMATINYQADTLLIGYFLTAVDVGYYGVAVAFSTFIWLVPQAIQTITYPATSEYWSTNNHVALQTMIDKSMKYTACILLPIGLGVGFFAKEIITIIFGSRFIYAVLPLEILIVGTVILGVAKSIGGAVTGVGRPDIGLKIVGISAITNVVFNILLIPKFGIAGAAVATAVSLSLASFLNLFIAIKMIKIKMDFKWYAKISGLSFSAILIFIRFEFINLYLLGIMILCVYVFMIATFFLKKEDKMYFMDIIRESCFFLKNLVYLK
ncbi:MAG: flippase [Candidatus Methanoperedens sp.]|nr:flippase [Candidatus Methanoperedens sp.]MCZ7370607.1 flippase [Candidatus Methanoperedens sp.]